MPKRWGNVFVGGVASALTAFDEVHTLDPEKSLQTTTAIAMQSAKLGFPSIIMSATLPDTFIECVKKRIEENRGKVEISVANIWKRVKFIFQYWMRTV